MTETRRTIKAPRIEVLLTPEADEKYGLFALLHMPDEGPGAAFELGGPYTRDEAVKAMLAVFTTIGEHHAFGDWVPPSLEIQ